MIRGRMARIVQGMGVVLAERATRSLRGSSLLRPALVVFAVLAALAGETACRDSGPSESRASDAGEGAGTGEGEVERITAKELGFSMAVNKRWNLSPITTLPPSGRVRTIAEIRRAPIERPFLVVPRLIVTSERSQVSTVEAAVQVVLSELTQLSVAPGGKLHQTSTGMRTLGQVRLGTLEATYSASESSGATKTVIQRSVLALLRDARDEVHVLTVTGTHLVEDDPLVARELGGMLTSIHIGPVARDNQRP